AVLVAEHDAARRVEDRIRILLDAGLVLLLFGGRLALSELVHRLLEHLGMRDQVVPHDRFDIAALGVRETLCRNGDGRAAKREGEQGGDEQTERTHWQILW